MSFGNNIGLPGMYSIKKTYKTETIGTYKIKSVNCPAGWNVWINGKKYFNNRLTRKEAIERTLIRHKESYNV